MASKANSELAAQFQAPHPGTSALAFLTAARTMLEKATAQKDLLVQQGMAPKLLDDLTAACTEFEKTLEATRAGRREHPSLRSGQVVGASTDLVAVAAEIAELVRVLDGLVRYQFGGNAELMGAWASARNVLGPFKSKGNGTPQVPSGQGAPVA